jgi:CDP-glycerol glycerophosphotransferase (TagB/SpsB family)
MYDNWDPATRDHIGATWFTDRQQHLDSANQAYTDAQKIGLSIDVPTSKRVVVFFSSSGDEIAELDLDWDEYFGTQDNALHALRRQCQRIQDTYLVVRTHPHKRRKPKLDVASWHETVSKINPDLHLDEYSDIDSYALMRQADIVVTYGSTTGIEAAFAGKPVIVMGPSAYDQLGVAQRVMNESQLQEALSAPRDSDPRGALAFGLMMTRRGFHYENVAKSSNFELNGIVLRDSNQLVLHISNYISKLVQKRLLG